VTRFPRMIDAARQMYVLTYLVSHEDEDARELAFWATVYAASSWIRYMDHLNHIEVCPSCAARAQLTSFIAERTPQESS
jgi:hypothetical protein